MWFRPQSSSKVSGARESRPIRVVCASALLCAAWLVAAAALFVNHVVFHGSQVGPGVSIGVASLAVYAVAIALVWRGSLAGRDVAVAFLILSAAPLPILGRLLVERSLWTASYIVAAFGLKAAGVVLLFTGESRQWFARDSSQVR